MAKSNVFKLLVLRAGGSAWDRDGRIVGDADLPMDQQGRDDVGSVIAGLDGERLSAILCAPDEASRESAEMLSRATGGAKVKVVKALAEVGMGLWEGVLGTDLESKCKGAYRQWLEDPSSVRAPEGEGFSEAQDRILVGLARTLEKIKAGDEGVGIVARPLAVGIIRGWLEHRGADELWEASKAARTRGEITRAALAGIHERSRAGA